MLLWENVGELLCHVMLLWESPLSPMLLWESVVVLLCYVMLLWESPLSHHVIVGECGRAPILRNVIVGEPPIPPFYCVRDPYPSLELYWRCNRPNSLYFK